MAQRHVIDANATLGLFLKLPYSKSMDDWMQARQADDAELVVPMLWEYECLTGFRRAVFLKLIPPEDADRMITTLYALRFRSVAPTIEIHRAAFLWAERIGQSKGYDAQYLALAEILGAQFWTADLRLFRTLRDLGIDWAHAIGSL